MSKTVVGLFNSTAAAQQVKQALVSGGYEASSIRIVANDNDEDFSSYGSSTTSGYGSSATSGTGSSTSGTSSVGSAATGVGEKISNFFKSLTGGDEHAHNHYAGGVNEGGALLTVTTDDSRANEVAQLLKQHGARDIDGGYQQAADLGTPVYGGSTANTGANLTGQTAIPVVEEELVVGKREVDRGGVRIYSHVVERPVEADVTLRDETVNVERRTVNRPATAADFGTGQQSFEVRASGEEAVVGKSSRVVEEVLVGKQESERTESVQDTVRKTEVEVEQIPGQFTQKTNY